jgi:hypothetical protein
MFTHQEIEHFRAFGYVVARGLLSPDEAGALRAEVVGALVEEFGGLGTDDDPHATGGIAGDYLPLALDRTPFSQALMADDPRLFQGSVEFLGQMTVPTVPVATCFTSNAGWHADHDRGVEGLKFLAHLDPRTAETGALRVLPGSHSPDFAARLRSYWAQYPGASGFEGWPVPNVVVETEPGDVIAFDAHLVHGSAGGDTRVAWTIEYLCWPGADRARLRAAVEESGPAWTEWAADPAAAPASRQTAIQRLRLLGVLTTGPG